MTAEVKGRIDWSLNRDNDGHREYKIRFHVETTDPLDGPAVVYFATGAPAIGAPWAYGNDSDPWAFCYPGATVTPIITREPNKHWILENTFGTKPLRRCQTASIENPLSEPQKLSGSFVKYVREMQRYYTGDLILSSSHERIQGLEIDAARASVVVEQNVSSLGLPTFTAMIDTLNDATLWGLPARRIKLSNISWERKLYGTCTYYYTRKFEFDVRFDGFDLYDVADAGYKRFHIEKYPDTPANRANPTKYIIAKEDRGENPPEKILLDGNGSPLTDPLNPIFVGPILGYGESNFLTLGIPTSL